MNAVDKKVIDFIDTQSKNLFCIITEDNSYSRFIEKKLNQYLDDLKALNIAISRRDVDDAIVDIEVVNNIIIEIIKKYENGDVYNATQRYNDLLRSSLVYKSLKATTIKLGKNQIFYRATVDSSNNNLRPERMFHIPFSLRRKIKNYRFSINGYPCLYLSNCSYLCWEEMNRPKLDEICIARYKFVGSTKKFFVVSIDPNDFLRVNIEKELNHKNRPEILAILKRYLLKIPLFMILLNRIKDKDDNFKPEYIFPQMFTNFIKNQMSKYVLGIRYPCTKISDNYVFFNYIFFSYPDIQTKNGFCKKLSKAFELSQGLPLMYSSLSGEYNRTFNPTYINTLINVGLGSSEYKSTIFFKHESMLEKSVLGKIK